MGNTGQLEPQRDAGLWVETSPRRARALGHLANVLCAVVLLPALWGATAASAAPQMPRPSMDGGLTDLDSDGRFSYDEFVHSLALKSMRGLNADGNGAEKVAAAPQQAASAPAQAASATAGRSGPALDLTLHFREIDTDHDGHISFDELKQAIGSNPANRKFFRNFDANDDGVLDSLEIDRMHAFPQIDIQF